MDFKILLWQGFDNFENKSPSELHILFSLFKIGSVGLDLCRSTGLHASPIAQNLRGRELGMKLLFHSHAYHSRNALDIDY
jgi:hypothetical protein